MESPRNPINLTATPEELFLMVGEREFTIYKLRVALEELMRENERLRAENGRLGKSDNND
jgi:hypothetical protein